jgi:uncharacterized membrane protein
MMPVVNFDEAMKQMVADTREPIPAKPGQTAKQDYEYRRVGTANIYMFFDRHRGWRKAKATEKKTADDFAECLRDLVDLHYPNAQKIRLVLDNLNTHNAASFDRFLPESLEQGADEDEDQNYRLGSLDDRDWYPVPVALSGYIKSVNNAALMSLARNNRTIVRMEHGIGAFVVQNTALLSLALTYPPEQKTIDALNAAYSIGPHRIVEQDPSFGIRQIVDIAIKALSPGVNDTSTAVMCLDYLTSLLAQLISRQFPPLHHYEGKTLRVIAVAPSFEALLALSFDQIRGSAEVNVAILARILGALDTIGSLAIRPNHLRALEEQLRCIAELADRTIKAIYEAVEGTRHSRSAVCIETGLKHQFTFMTGTQVWCVT